MERRKIKQKVWILFLHAHNVTLPYIILLSRYLTTKALSLAQSSKSVKIQARNQTNRLAIVFAFVASVKIGQGEFV